MNELSFLIGVVIALLLLHSRQHKQIIRLLSETGGAADAIAEES